MASVIVLDRYEVSKDVVELQLATAQPTVCNTDPGSSFCVGVLTALAKQKSWYWEFGTGFCHQVQRTRTPQNDNKKEKDSAI
ncbi:hypothetical protein C5167_017072 [Papaver somniferum]|uniref:Uncharacterized protein n=1 Tax=Papaver somniferum TaxID=3469 RepID=A0A4Y7IMF5_PAPSO|nr:hypothetical protein C5167_017072 [Papaver somniferum]